MKNPIQDPSQYLERFLSRRHRRMNGVQQDVFKQTLCVLSGTPNGLHFVASKPLFSVTWLVATMIHIRRKNGLQAAT